MKIFFVQIIVVTADVPVQLEVSRVSHCTSILFFHILFIYEYYVLQKNIVTPKLEVRGVESVPISGSVVFKLCRVFIFLKDIISQEYFW